MLNGIELGGELFDVLTTIDEKIVERVAEGGCAYCGGPLHRGDYPRKPRGGLIAEAVGAFEIRFSLCCGRDGCRKRATPPSVRFLGRRVYVGAVVIVASVVALHVTSAAALRRATGIAARTVRRWLGWWRGPFTATSCSSRSALASCQLPRAVSCPIRSSPDCVARPRHVWRSSSRCSHRSRRRRSPMERDS
jgi:hypothetical protein